MLLFFIYSMVLCLLDKLTAVYDRIARAFNKSGAGYMSCSTWYSQDFQQGLAYWSSSKN